MSDLYAPIAGFQLAGVASGIKKKKGALDLGLILADEAVPAAGVFTKNRVKAAPVLLAMERLQGGKAHAVLVNSGNANACTGKKGAKAAEQTTLEVAQALGIRPSNVLPASTGVIGVVLPTRPVKRSAKKLVRDLAPDGAARFAEAILTTDQGPKAARAHFKHGRRECSVLAIAKGAGMIHPDMATTLAFVLTDAPVKKGFLRRALREATDATFNRISVDGDTSTNDCILALASGAAGGKPIRDGKKQKGAPRKRGVAARRFVAALKEVLEDVALQIVADGEGAQHVARIVVKGAKDDRAALTLARTIATSSLVKTAIHGCDPNWGRILGAAGRAGVELDWERAEVRVGDVVVFRRGVTTMDRRTEKRAAAVMKRVRYDLELRLKDGKGAAHYWTCDLGHEYVRINADYRT